MSLLAALPLICMAAWGVSNPTDQSPGVGAEEQIARSWYAVERGVVNLGMERIRGYVYDYHKEPLDSDEFKNCEKSKAVPYGKHTVKAIAGTGDVLALLSCPGMADSGHLSILAVFDKENIEVPRCLSRVNLIHENESNYFWWGAAERMEFRRQRDGSLFLLIRLHGADAGDRWTVSALVHVGVNCDVTMLSRFYSSSHFEFDGGCHGTELSHQFVGVSTVHVALKEISCTVRERKRRVSRRTIAAYHFDLPTLLGKPWLRISQP